MSSSSIIPIWWPRRVTWANLELAQAEKQCMGRSCTNREAMHGLRYMHNYCGTEKVFTIGYGKFPELVKVYVYNLKYI